MLRNHADKEVEAETWTKCQCPTEKGQSVKSETNSPNTLSFNSKLFNPPDKFLIS